MSDTKFDEISRVNLRKFQNFLSFYNFNPESFLEFLNKTRLMTENTVESLVKPNFLFFPLSEILIIDETHCQIIASETKCLKIPVISFCCPEEFPAIDNFLQNFKNLQPFTIGILGFFNLNSEEENIFSINSWILIKDFENFADNILQDDNNSKRPEIILKYVVQLIYLCVASNLSGFHGILYQKGNIVLDEADNIKFLPLIILLSNKKKNRYKEYFCPELMNEAENLENFSKIDSWILGLLIFKLAFGKDYWELYREYLEKEGVQIESEKDSKSQQSQYQAKILLFFRKKDRISLDFINTFENQNSDSPNLKQINSRLQSEKTPEMKSEILNESINSLPLTPLKYPATSFTTKDAIKEFEVPSKDFFSLKSFLLSLVEKAIAFNPEERPAPIELLFEIHKYLRANVSIKGVFQYIPESLLFHNFSGQEQERKKAYFPMGSQEKHKIFVEKKQKYFENDDIIASFDDEGNGSWKNKGLGFDFEGKMIGFLPHEGILKHKIWGFGADNKEVIKFDSNSWIPEKKFRNNMLYKCEQKGKNIAQFEDFNRVAEEFQNHRDKPFLIDLFNNHYISDFGSDGAPLYFFNIVNKTSQPLFFINLGYMFYFHKGKILLYDAFRGLFSRFNAQALADQPKVSLFDIFSLFQSCEFELFSLNGMKFIGQITQNSSKFKGKITFNTMKVEFINEFPAIPLDCRVVYPNGDLYEGEIINGQYSGQGRYIYKGLYTFEGTFSQDIFVKGTIFYHSPKYKIKKYEGEVLYIPYSKSYLRHGKGKLIFCNGDFYEGEFFRDLYHGKGKLFINEDSILYEGDFFEGKKQGKGFLRSFNKETYYEGEFYNDNKEGFGKEVYKDKTIFQGIFSAGKRQGSGFFVNNQGVFKGEFLKDRKDGDALVKTQENQTFAVKYYKDKVIRKKKIKENEREKQNNNKKLSFI